MNLFTTAVKRKGWLMKTLGKRWGLSARQMSNIAKDPKIIHWDALAGIPDRSE